MNSENLYSKLVEDMAELKHALTIDQANFNHYISNTNHLEVRESVLNIIYA